jgi:branched-chain amino acid aminotransferase
MPVATLDGETVGSGRMGPLTRRIRETYWAWHADPRWTTPVRYP